LYSTNYSLIGNGIRSSFSRVLGFDPYAYDSDCCY
jgi:hypothetical protein